MKRFSLFAVAFILTLAASAAAQQTILVEHNDKNDPCARFKMRILVPADIGDRILPVREFSGGLDAKMVWNPCGMEQVKIASIFSNVTPDKQGLLLSNLPAFIQGRNLLVTDQKGLTVKPFPEIKPALTPLVP